ncbi:MAG: hypothetical protein ACOY0T_41245 [Myxococcota bacterium]
MKMTRMLLFTAMVAGCSAHDQTAGSGTTASNAADATQATEQTPSTANENASEPVGPARDDEAQFARRFAAVSEVVGEAAAQRVMVSADTQAEPLYQLALPNGNMMDWYEVLAGVPVAVEHGSNTSAIAPELRLKKLRPTELYAALAPGAELPTALVELDRRQLEMAPVYRQLMAAKERYGDVRLAPLQSSVGDVERQITPSEQVSADRVARSQSALTAQQCLDKSPACSSNPISMKWRIIHADRTADSTISRSDVLSVFGVGCCQSGLITYRVRYRTWWSWTTWFSYDMPAGTWVEPWYLSTDLLDFDFEGKLYNFQAGDKGSQCAAGPS